MARMDGGSDARFFSEHMPPLAAAGFLGAAIALCLELLPHDRRRFYRQTVTLLALGMFITASLVVVRYAIGTPAYSDPAAMPLALPTAICFALLGLSIAIHSGLDFLDRDLTEMPADRRRIAAIGRKTKTLLRAILPGDHRMGQGLSGDALESGGPTDVRLHGGGNRGAIRHVPDPARSAKKRQAIIDEPDDEAGLAHEHTQSSAKDGRTIVSRWNNTPLTDAGGNFLGVVSLCEEITDTTKASEELERLAAVVRNCSELIGISNLESELVFLNEAGCKMTGISPYNVPRHSYMEFVADHLHEKAEREILPAVLRGETWQGELQYRNLKTRKLVDVEATIFGICDPTTGLPRYLACISARYFRPQAGGRRIARKGSKAVALRRERQRFHLVDQLRRQSDLHLAVGPKAAGIHSGGVRPLYLQGLSDARFGGIRPKPARKSHRRPSARISPRTDILRIGISPQGRNDALD